MALKASGFGGTSALHELQGLLCDLCGQEADSETTEVVALDCSFAKCPPDSGLYHQACLEKYLKSIKCERNRKIGFPCPRGCGKATQFSSACPGKILKSHPISIRGEANKKRRQAELESLQRSNSNDKDPASQAKAAKKGNSGGGVEEPKLSRSQSGASTSPSETGKGGKMLAKTASIKALNGASAKLTPASSTSSMSTLAAATAAPKSAAAAKKEALAAAARNLKNEIAARSGGAIKASVLQSAAAAGPSMVAVHVSKTKEVKTLDEYLAERHGSSSALDRSTSSASGASQPAPPAANAWASKSRVSSASSLATELAGQGEAALDSDSFPPAPAIPAAVRPPVPLPRAPSTAGAAAAGAVAVPVPAQPLPPRGAWAQKQSAVLSVVPPPPPPPRGAVAGTAAASQAPAKAAVVTTLAQQQEEAVERKQQQEQPPKLSKSQRKNLRRAEKKAAAAMAGPAGQDFADASSQDGSPSSDALSPPAPESVPAGYGMPPGMAALHHHHPPPPPPPPLCSPGPEPFGDLLDRCLQLVVQNKLQKQVEGLASLGFPHSAALAAVQQHGGNLEGAVATLLEQATGVCDPGHSLGGGPLPEVDLSEELAFMQALQCKYRLPEGVLESTVVDCNGDLEASARVIVEQCGDSISDVGSSTAGAELLGGGGSLFDLPPAAAAAPSQHHPAMQLQQEQQLGGGWGWPGEPLPYLGSRSRPSGEMLGESSTSNGGCLYSAFGFGGFTEAALHAVHGPYTHGSSGGGGGATSLFSSLDSSSLGGLTPRHNQLAGQPGLQGSRLGLWAEPTSPPRGLSAAESPMHSQLPAVGRGPPPHFGRGEPGAHHRTLSPFDRQPLTMSPTPGPPPASYPAHAPLVANDGPGGGLFGRGGLEQQPWPGPQWGSASSGGVYGGGNSRDDAFFGGAGGLQGAGLPGQAPGLVQQSLLHGGGPEQHPGRLLQERELSELMSALLCR